jgi:hypothetical protein
MVVAVIPGAVGFRLAGFVVGAAAVVGATVGAVVVAVDAAFLLDPHAAATRPTHTARVRRRAPDRRPLIRPS